MGLLVSTFLLLGGICADLNSGVPALAVSGLAGGRWLMNPYRSTSENPTSSQSSIPPALSYSLLVTAAEAWLSRSGDKELADRGVFDAGVVRAERRSLGACCCC